MSTGPPSTQWSHVTENHFDFGWTVPLNHLRRASALRNGSERASRAYHRWFDPGCQVDGPYFYSYTQAGWWLYSLAAISAVFNPPLRGPPVIASGETCGFLFCSHDIVAFRCCVPHLPVQKKSWKSSLTVRWHYPGELYEVISSEGA